MFAGRTLVIATKHQKEKVLAPILERELAVNCILEPRLDTDVFGTFTGEVERKNDPIETARKKCLLAMDIANCELAIASEGSFGPHPAIFFAPADEEYLCFIDKINEIEVVVRDLTTDTNYNHIRITSEDQLTAFSSQVKFPAHALIVRKAHADSSDIVKGITTMEQLHQTIHHFLNAYGEAFVETDMRAMHNPTRMKAIEKTCLKLVHALHSQCPACKCPGFSATASKQGLPCALCHFPTRSIRSLIYACKKCAYSEEVSYPNGKLNEDPMFCDRCNP
jgi:hypothetical protein